MRSAHPQLVVAHTSPCWDMAFLSAPLWGCRHVSPSPHRPKPQTSPWTPVFDLCSTEKLLCGAMKSRLGGLDVGVVLGKGCYSVLPSCSWVC